MAGVQPQTWMVPPWGSPMMMQMPRSMSSGQGLPYTRGQSAGALCVQAFHAPWKQAAPYGLLQTPTRPQAPRGQSPQPGQQDHRVQRRPQAPPGQSQPPGQQGHGVQRQTQQQQTPQNRQGLMVQVRGQTPQPPQMRGQTPQPPQCYRQGQGVEARAQLSAGPFCYRGGMQTPTNNSTGGQRTPIRPHSEGQNRVMRGTNMLRTPTQPTRQQTRPSSMGQQARPKSIGPLLPVQRVQRALHFHNSPYSCNFGPPVYGQSPQPPQAQPLVGTGANMSQYSYLQKKMPARDNSKCNGRPKMLSNHLSQMASTPDGFGTLNSQLHHVQCMGPVQWMNDDEIRNGFTPKRQDLRTGFTPKHNVYSHGPPPLLLSTPGRSEPPAAANGHCSAAPSSVPPLAWQDVLAVNAPPPAVLAGQDVATHNMPDPCCPSTMVINERGPAAAAAKAHSLQPATWEQEQQRCDLCASAIGAGLCITTGCGHLFHPDCLEGYVKQLIQKGVPNMRCPSCMTHLDVGSILAATQSYIEAQSNGRGQQMLAPPPKSNLALPPSMPVDNDAKRDVQWIKDLKRESLPPLAAQSSSAMAPMQPEMSDYVLLEPAPQEDARPCNESHNMDKNTAGATCEQPRPDIQMTRLQILQELCSPREASNSKKKADDPIEDESKAKFKHFVDVVDSTSAEQLRLETKMLGMSSPEACSEPREPTPPTDSGISVEVGIFAQEIFTPLKKEAKVKKMNVHVDKTSFVTTSTTPGRKIPQSVKNQKQPLRQINLQVRAQDNSKNSPNIQGLQTERRKSKENAPLRPWGTPKQIKEFRSTVARDVEVRKMAGGGIVHMSPPLPVEISPGRLVGMWNNENVSPTTMPMRVLLM